MFPYKVMLKSLWKQPIIMLVVATRKCYFMYNIFGNLKKKIMFSLQFL